MQKKRKSENLVKKKQIGNEQGSMSHAVEKVVKHKNAFLSNLKSASILFEKNISN